jgi:hypothetical protein
MQRIVFGSLAIFTACCWFCDNSATAGLIVSPSSGTLLFQGDPTDPSDKIFKMDAWSDFGGRFFGNAHSSLGYGIFVSEDGNINFTNNQDFFTDNAKIARIAPLWDDYLLLQSDPVTVNNQIRTHRDTGYIGVTWENLRLSNETVANQPFPASNRSFQVLWFDKDTQINGFTFKADDIAFSYAGDVIRGSDGGRSVHASFVGLQSGGDLDTNLILNGTRDGDGILFDGDSAKFGLGANLDGFLLFRRNGNTYDVTAVPEPSSLLCVAIAISLLSIVAAWRKRVALRPSLHAPSH